MLSGVWCGVRTSCSSLASPRHSALSFLSYTALHCTVMSCTVLYCTAFTTDSTLPIDYSDGSKNEDRIGSIILQSHSIEATEVEAEAAVVAEVGREHCRALLKMSFST